MDRKIFLVGLGLFLLILTVGAAVFLFKTPASFRGTAFDKPYPVAPEFELTRSDGTSFRLSQTRGHVVLLFFGYTSCPDICPATMAKLKLTLLQLKKEDAARVKVVFVTVDPLRDTPAIAQNYVDRFNIAFIGLGGSQAELAKVWQAYGIFADVQPGDSLAAALDHTARVTLIDQRGNMRVFFGTDVSVEDIVHDLFLVLTDRNAGE